LGPQRVISQVIGHRVDEMDIGEARVLEMPGQIGDPRRRPVSRDLSPAGVIVGVNQNDAHQSLPNCQEKLTAVPSAFLDSDQISDGG
jgi:hypothetical protein